MNHAAEPLPENQDEAKIERERAMAVSPDGEDDPDSDDFHRIAALGEN
ncbi:MAG TPA: hypothetical protein VN086_00275 [Candidatus Paceibacterota bacterium]|nr:hypothetical protein [Candidatus Paceibacterota bacterium]